MKYVIVLGDGMGDYPVEELNGQTPLQKAHKPTIDYLAAHGVMGEAQTIPEEFSPGSDIANLSVMGYNPAECYSGRSPLEAASIGVELEENDVSFRCNLVTLSDEKNFVDKQMVDYCSQEISTPEARELIDALNEKLATEKINFYSGISYRHLMLWREGPEKWELTPPHDILGEKIANYLPRGEHEKTLQKIMEESFQILKNHPINLQRSSRGLQPANTAWIWGEGKKPAFTPFSKKFGLQGGVISAVDLIKGIGHLSAMKVIEVEGATGNIDTNYAGKAGAALQALDEGLDLVYIHIEAPDECGHRHEIENKVKAIEYIDHNVVKLIKEKLDFQGEEYKIMVLPDHYTPLSLRTHTKDPVPFVIYQSNFHQERRDRGFHEESAKAAANYHPYGYRLMEYFLNNK